mmetsp:Transcript_101374/g.316013  ORF Transcript_101374/g.316013 Transcript_101374/m.316013 type:complete len:341 (-) Transcript_101374:39-1061(-)
MLPTERLLWGAAPPRALRAAGAHRPRRSGGGIAAPAEGRGGAVEDVTRAEHKHGDHLDLLPRGLARLLPRPYVFARRTGALLVVLERLQDGHNYCAVLRTMEALGVQHIWVVSPPSMESKNNIERRRLAELTKEAKKSRVKRWAAQRHEALWQADAWEDEENAAFAKGAQRWLSVREFESTEDCISALREAGREIWVTALEQAAEVLAPGAPWLSSGSGRGVPRRMAVVMGAEGSGVSSAFKAAADRLVYLPINGFAESLNVSVAAALVVQLILQLLAQSYSEDELCLEPDEVKALRTDWYKRLARTEDDHELYRSYLDSPPPPFDDLRRPDAHRQGRHH